MLSFPTIQKWDSATCSHTVLLSATKERMYWKGFPCNVMWKKIVWTLLDEAEHSFRQNFLAYKHLLSRVVCSDMLPSSWVALHMALIYRILSASLLPGSAICTGPIWILNNFLPGVSVGEAPAA